MSDEERDFEAEASKEGWAPQEQWKGDPDKWKTAEQFVKDGENINGILKSRVGKLEERVSEVLNSNRQLNELSKRALAKEKAENERLLDELAAARKQAVTDGDGDAFERADREIQNLRNFNTPEGPQPLPPAAQEWIAKNDWYGKNDTLSIQADGIADRLRAQGFDDTSPVYFAELTKRVQEAFPNEFENPKRNRPNGVESGGTKSVKDSGKKTFDDLPKEAKDQLALFQRDIPDFKKEDYLSQYEWE
jgi:hypothetical protein